LSHTYLPKVFLRRQAGKKQKISSAVFSPDGQRILTASYGDHTAKLWRTPAN
jgi:WD40 repeat protein